MTHDDFNTCILSDYQEILRGNQLVETNKLTEVAVQKKYKQKGGNDTIAITHSYFPE